VERRATVASRRAGGLRRALTTAVVLAVGLVAGSASHAPASAARAGGRPLAPRLFSPGACVAFAPRSRGPRASVFIDAGHGGPDPGAVGVTLGGRVVHEADETVRVAHDVVPLLRARGYRVVLSRTGRGAVARLRPGDISGALYTAAGVHHDLLARDECANRARARVLVGVYFNAAADGGIGGSITLYDRARAFWRRSRLLARLLQRRVLTSLRAGGNSVPDDGVHTDVGFGSSVSSADRDYHHLLILGPAKRGYIAAPSRMPGALIEPLFLTNPAEATLANSRRGQRAIARGLAGAIVEYLARRRR
jgi:N-acetylmuramoyl-L-alanine amidase